MDRLTRCRTTRWIQDVEATLMGWIVTSAMTSVRREVQLLGCVFKWLLDTLLRYVNAAVRLARSPSVLFVVLFDVLRIRTQLSVALAHQDQRICESCSESVAPDLAMRLACAAADQVKGGHPERRRAGGSELPKGGELERSPSSVGSRAKSRQPCPSFAPRAPTLSFQTWC